MNEVTQPLNWDLILKFAQFGLTIVLGIYMWITNRDKVTNSRITTFQEKVDTRLDEKNIRITRLEEKVNGLEPVSGSIGKVHHRLDQLQQSVAKQTGELEGVHKTMNSTLALLHKLILKGE